MELSDKDKRTLDVIFQKGVLIDLNISFWHGRKALKPEDLGLDAEKVNKDLFSLGQKRHLPKEWVRKFSRIDTNARLLLDEWAFRYGTTQAHFIPLNALPVLIQKLEELQSEFFETVAEFQQVYNEVKYEMLEAYEKEAKQVYKRLKQLKKKKAPARSAFIRNYMDKIEGFYPSSIRHKFSFSWNFFEVTLPREHEIEAVEVHQKLQEAEQQQHQADEIIRRYREQATRQASEFMNSCIQQLRTATIEICNRITHQITKDGGTVTDKRLDRIKEFIGKFRMMNFLDDREVNHQLGELERTLQLGNAKKFNSDEELRNQLQNALGKVVDATKQIAPSDVVGRSLGYVRKVAKKSDE